MLSRDARRIHALSRDKLLQIPGVAEAEVTLVWDPPWSREMMSEAARLEMGIHEGTLRLSVGLEDAQDLIDDLDQALKAAGV